MADFLGESSPGMTGIGVVSLASPETLVEIEAIAKSKEVKSEPRNYWSDKY